MCVCACGVCVCVHVVCLCVFVSIWCLCVCFIVLHKINYIGMLPTLFVCCQLFFGKTNTLKLYFFAINQYVGVI